MAKTRRRGKRQRAAKRPHCQGCGEDDLKIVPVVVTVEGRRLAKWLLCRPCAAGRVHALNPWVKK